MIARRVAYALAVAAVAGGILFALGNTPAYAQPEIGADCCGSEIFFQKEGKCEGFNDLCGTLDLLNLKFRALLSDTFTFFEPCDSSKEKICTLSFETKEATMIGPTTVFDSGGFFKVRTARGELILTGKFEGETRLVSKGDVGDPATLDSLGISASVPDESSLEEALDEAEIEILSYPFGKLHLVGRVTPDLTFKFGPGAGEWDWSAEPLVSVPEPPTSLLLISSFMLTIGLAVSRRCRRDTLVGNVLAS